MSATTKKRATPPHAIRKGAERHRSDEHAEEAGSQHRGERYTAQLELVGEHRPQHTREKDVEEIEERPDAGDRDDEPMRAGDG